MKKTRQQAAGKGRGDRSCRRRLWLARSVALLLAVGCGSRASREEPKPIAECQSYERALFDCTGRQVSLLSQVAAAKTTKEREGMQKLCAINLQRIREACR
jgi:hypothetical protein